MSKRNDLSRYLGILTLLANITILGTGCSQEGSAGNQGEQTTIGGSVGDGPVVDALVTVKDAYGIEIARTYSDDHAKYRTKLPAAARYPLTIMASGGTDTVSGKEPPFSMTSIAVNKEAKIANVNPYSTFIEKLALKLPGGINETNLSRAKDIVVQRMNFGLDLKAVPNPITTQISAFNTAHVIKGSEALGETINRVHGALRESDFSLNHDQIINLLAGDLIDDVIDGEGFDADARLAAVTTIISTKVLFEALINRLEVNGEEATERLDAAIKLSEPEAITEISDVEITPESISQLQTSVSAAMTLSPTPALSEIERLVAQLTINSSASEIEAEFPDGMDHELELAASLTVSASDEELEAVNKKVRDQFKRGKPMPTITLSTDHSTVPYQGSTSIHWVAKHATSCTASGDWSGIKTTKGSEKLGPLTHDSIFTLSCNSSRGEVTQSVRLSVEIPQPSVVLNAQPEFVEYNGTSTLTWSSSHASSCAASGAWSGTLTTTGSKAVGPLTSASAFTISCIGTGGQTTETVTIEVGAPPVEKPTLSLQATPSSIPYNGSTTLNWTSANTTSCSASGGWSGSKSTSGTQVLGPFTTDRLFTLTCSGTGGQISQSVTVTVSPAPPTVSLQANPATVDYNGTTTIAWSSTHTTSCTASGAWSGNKNTSGSTSVGPLTHDSTYTLSCSGAGGSESQAVTVKVNPPPAPTVSLSANPSSIDFDGTSTLIWFATDAASCRASGSWTGSKSLSGMQTVGPLTEDSTYTLTCSGDGGDKTQAVSITVASALEPTVTLTANPSSIEYNGTATLNWSAEYATMCTASVAWSGSKATSGSENVGPLDANSTFTLTCSGPGGSNSESITVAVSPQAKPTVSFSANPPTVSYNETTTLTWSSTDATSCSASGAWSGSKNTSGSDTVGPIDGDRTFSLSCTGGGGTTNRSVTVTINQHNNGTASLAWDPPTTNEDGSGLNDLAGYEIHYGNQTGSYQEMIDIPNAGVSSYVVQNLSPNIYYFIVKAYDLDGNRSAASNEASIVIP